MIPRIELERILRRRAVRRAEIADVRKTREELFDLYLLARKVLDLPIKDHVEHYEAP